MSPSIEPDRGNVERCPSARVEVALPLLVAYPQRRLQPGFTTRAPRAQRVLFGLPGRAWALVPP